MSFSPLAPVAGLLSRACVALTVVASLAAAQTVTVHGDLENVGGQFVFSCTPLTLVSGGPDLQPFLGMNVVATGTVVGTDTFSVQTIAADPNEFEISNDVSVGGTIDFEVSGQPGTQVQIWIALADDFNVVKKQGLFLDTSSLFLLAQGVITGGGDFEITFNVPNDPTLAGVEIFAQAVFLEPGGGFTLGNADCVTITP